jgi:hypothetical protein
MGLTAPVHLPAAIKFSVSVFYSEIPQIISLDFPKLIDLPGFGQEFLIIIFMVPVTQTTSYAGSFSERLSHNFP